MIAKPNVVRVGLLAAGDCFVRCGVKEKTRVSKLLRRRRRRRGKIRKKRKEKKRKEKKRKEKKRKEKKRKKELDSHSSGKRRFMTL